MNIHMKILINKLQASIAELSTARGQHRGSLGNCKNEDGHKKEDDPKNEDSLKNEDNLINED